MTTGTEMQSQRRVKLDGVCVHALPDRDDRGFAVERDRVRVCELEGEVAFEDGAGLRLVVVLGVGVRGKSPSGCPRVPTMFAMAFSSFVVTPGLDRQPAAQA